MKKGMWTKLKGPWKEGCSAYIILDRSGDRRKWRSTKVVLMDLTLKSSISGALWRLIESSPLPEDKVTLSIPFGSEFPHCEEERLRCMQKEMLWPAQGHPEGGERVVHPSRAPPNPPGHTSFSSPWCQAGCAGCHRLHTCPSEPPLVPIARCPGLLWGCSVGHPQDRSHHFCDISHLIIFHFTAWV